LFDSIWWLIEPHHIVASGYSPYYFLHGREMNLPTSHDLRMKLMPDVRETEYASRLENLKSTLKSSYKLV